MQLVLHRFFMQSHWKIRCKLKATNHLVSGATLQASIVVVCSMLEAVHRSQIRKPFSEYPRIAMGGNRFGFFGVVKFSVKFSGSRPTRNTSYVPAWSYCTLFHIRFALICSAIDTIYTLSVDRCGASVERLVNGYDVMMTSKNAPPFHKKFGLVIVTSPRFMCSLGEKTNKIVWAHFN